MLKLSLAEPDPLPVRFAGKRVWEHATILLVLLEFNLNDFLLALGHQMTPHAAILHGHA